MSPTAAAALVIGSKLGVVLEVEPVTSESDQLDSRCRDVCTKAQ